jgi:FkbM family methyltransferase
VVLLCARARARYSQRRQQRMEPLWSPWSQPVASDGKALSRENAKTSQTAATARSFERMVRRGRRFESVRGLYESAACAAFAFGSTCRSPNVTAAGPAYGETLRAPQFIDPCDHTSMAADATLARAWRVARRDGAAGLVRAAGRRAVPHLRRFYYLSKSDFLRRRRAYRVNGNVMELPDDVMAWTFSDGTYYERNVEYWFRQALEAVPGAVVYDVGANYGYYTLVAAALADAVYAFEPVSSTYVVLRQNVDRNRLSNVEIVRLALGAESATRPITLYSASGSNSIARPPESVEHLEIKGFENVPVRTLDSLLADRQIRPPDLIKIDTEGSELAVLCGARSTLASYRPLLIFEHRDKIARDAGYTLDSIRDELRPYGYELRGLSDPFVGDRHDRTLYRVISHEASATIGTLVAVPRNDVWLAVFSLDMTRAFGAS